MVCAWCESALNCCCMSRTPRKCICNPKSKMAHIYGISQTQFFYSHSASAAHLCSRYHYNIGMLFLDFVFIVCYYGGSIFRPKVCMGIYCHCSNVSITCILFGIITYTHTYTHTLAWQQTSSIFDHAE